MIRRDGSSYGKVARAGRVGSELEQPAWHLHGTCDVMLPLHRLAHVDQHDIAGVEFARRLVHRHRSELCHGIGDHVS